MNINISIAMYLDANKKDPDTYSKTLHNYHHLLWNRQLSNGESFDLKQSNAVPYYFKSSILNHKFIFSSDSIIHTYSRRESMREIVEKFSK